MLWKCFRRFLLNKYLISLCILRERRGTESSFRKEAIACFWKVTPEMVCLHMTAEKWNSNQVLSSSLSPSSVCPLVESGAMGTLCMVGKAHHLLHDLVLSQSSHLGYGSTRREDNDWALSLPTSCLQTGLDRPLEKHTDMSVVDLSDV